MKKLKVLHCYWTQYNDKALPGGGVRVYMNNLISQQRKYYDVYTLSSGTEYTFGGNCHVRFLGNDNGVRQFSLVNSPVLSPSKCSFANLDVYLNDTVIADQVSKFLKENGPFDVIHFHSLEGVSLATFRLKEDFPETKFILTLHNYYPFCPQVNLWYKDSQSCEDFGQGMKCTECIPHLPNPKMVKLEYEIITYMRYVSLAQYAPLFVKKAKAFYDKHKASMSNGQSAGQAVNPTSFYQFRMKNVEYINQYFDHVLCVSDRVKQLAIGFGICKELCTTLYIGTKFAENQALTIRQSVNDQVLHIAYMGYMRHDKGFYFFLECLENMPVELSRKLEVTIAARYTDQQALDRLKNIESKYKALHLYNGYTHDNMATILSTVNLGVVPVLWEDNLPQIAMEFKSMGIPVLSSDRGGARELTDDSHFVFKAGNMDDFKEKLTVFVENQELLGKYYEYGRRLISTGEHCSELNKIYVD